MSFIMKVLVANLGSRPADFNTVAATVERWTPSTPPSTSEGQS